jgi:rSAM/selenodomain-associated transferase 1
MSAVRILIFAKAPVAGLAKTRLIPSLGAQGAAELARRMLAYTVEQALSAGVGPVELCVTPSPADPVWQAFAAPTSASWSDQGEGDLGARMARAARRSDGTGEAVLLIGTDCPALDAALLQSAAQSLETFDATLVPSADGGYVLLGLKRFHASLFQDIEWSTATVARETLLRLDELGCRVHIRPKVHDIDEPADLQWLPHEWRKSGQETA